MKAGVKCDFGILSSVKLPPQSSLPTALCLREESHEQDISHIVSSHHSPRTTTITPRRSRSHSPNLPSQINTPPNRLLDMRLFHHYLELTSGGYLNAFGTQHASDESTTALRATWFNWIVGVAKESAHLMDALLALSAFHLQHVHVADPAVVAAGHVYMARSIQEHSRQLRQGINSENAEAVFATSTCIAFFVTSGRHVDDNGEQDLDLLHWFQPWQGVSAVLQRCWGFLNAEALKSLIHTEHPSLLSNPGTNVHNGHDQPLDTFNFLIDDLSPFDADPEAHAAYTTSVQCLNLIYASPVHRHVIKFPGFVTKRYVDLVAAEDPRALAILGYYFMLVVRVEQVWWLQGAAERDFAILMKRLPETWKSRMTWAVEGFELYEGFNRRVS